MTPERLQEIKLDDLQYVTVNGVAKHRRELLVEITALKERNRELHREMELRSSRETRAHTYEESTQVKRIAELNERFALHTKAVERFLSDMLCTMVDPLADGITDVKKVCETLLKAAAEQRQREYDKDAELERLHNFKPTADQINALPEPLKQFIHYLEANCDPAGIIAENILIRDATQALENIKNEQAEELERLRTALDKDRREFMSMKQSLRRGVQPHELCDQIIQCEHDADDALKL